MSLYNRFHSVVGATFYFGSTSFFQSVVLRHNDDVSLKFPNNIDNAYESTDTVSIQIKIRQKEMRVQVE